MKKLWTIVKKGLSQFSDSLDALNESINTTRKAEKLNKNFLLGLDSFIDSLNRAVDTAVYINEINKFKKVSPDHTEIFDKYLTETKLAIDEKIKLVRLKPVFVSPDVRQSSLALNQRKEKIHDCLGLIDKVERDVSGSDTLLKILEEETDQSSFNDYLVLQKGVLTRILQAHSQDEVDHVVDLPKQSSDSKITVSWPPNLNKEKPRLFSGNKHAHHFSENASISDTEIRKQKIKALVAKRNIKALVHFTRIENLPSIIEEGLIGRNDLESKNIDVEINDKLRLDNATNAISTSISFPNYKMFYSYQKKSPNADWAVIKLDPCILWELDCAFNITNAAAKTTSKIPLEDRKTFEALEQMFDDNVGSGRDRLNLNIPENYPTNPQAEVLVLDVVNPKYIQSVCLNEKTKINNLPLVADKVGPFLSSVNFFFEPGMYAPRIDYEYWLAPSSDALNPEQENPYIRHFDF